MHPFPISFFNMSIDTSTLSLGSFNFGSSKFFPNVQPDYRDPGTDLSINLNNFTLDLDAIQLKADDYQRLEHRDQIYKEPDTYLGNVDRIPNVLKVLDFTDPQNPKFVDINIDFPSGCARLFYEILYNATDNVIESRNRHHDIGSIVIIANNKTICVRNGGIPIPIQMNEKEKKWVPEMIFGTLLTSGQYKKTERTGSGKNGYGSKLTNIFSKFFKVRVGNPYDKKLYEQQWENNMLVCHLPIITDGYAGEPFVEVTFTMDFERFGYTEYPNEVLALYAASAAEISFALDVPIYFNGISLSNSDILDFKKLTGYTTENYIVHYEYPPGTDLKEIKMPNGTRTAVSKDPSIRPIVKLCVIDSPDEGTIYSFANSAHTIEGGVHVEAVYDHFDIITEVINNSVKSKKDDKLTRKQALNKTNLKSHLTIILSCTDLVNARFTSQEKVKLTNPKPKISINERVIKLMTNWEMAIRLQRDLAAKLNRDATGNRKKFLTANGYDKAYYAGVPDKSLQCVLYEVEGKSAMGYAFDMKSAMNEEKRDYIGVFAQMGKPLNVRTAKLLKLYESKKYQRLLLAIGLEEGIDYSKDENFVKLNYGALALLNDADVDGLHIDGLLLNIFYCRYRSLLQRPFICLVRTPIIRIWKGKESRKFYSIAGYNKFMANHPECRNWEIKYYKGLGSSDRDEVTEETSNPRIAQLLYDDTCPKYFDLAFSNDKGLSDKRKDWISNHILMDGIEEIKMLPISHFLNFELIQHAVYNMARTIPKFDGLKIGQRKILFGSYDTWKSGIGTSTKQEKTNHLANHVSKISNYHHGEKSLIDTINRMLLSYPGTNNLRYFVPKGQFGTRNDAGEDAGDARYTYCYPEWWIPYVFNSEDLPLLKPVLDEGKQWEPEFYLPVIPTIMINGALGIGTGSSTFICNFNPVDVCMALKDLISGVAPKQLIPWYRGFKGTIILHKYGDPINIGSGVSVPVTNIDISKLNLRGLDPKANNNEQDENDGQLQAKLEDGTDDHQSKLEDLDDTDILDAESTKKKEGYRMITTGRFEIMNKHELEVTEIPIGKSFKQYEQFLENLKDEKKIKGYKNSCRYDEAKFIIYGYRDINTAEKLGLIKGFSLTNMILLDENNHPVKFKDPNDLLQTWFNWRLPFYQQRKDNLLNKKKSEIIDKTYKMKFIIAVIDGTENGYIQGRNIILMKQNKALVAQQMQLLGIPDKYMGAKSTHYTIEELNKLQNKINQLNEEYNKLSVINPEELMMVDINRFLDKYLKVYPEEKNRL